MSIREKLTLVFAMVGVLPILALVLLSHRFSRENIREDAFRRNALVANEIAHQIESTIAMTLWGVENLATNPDLIGDTITRRDRLAEIYRLQDKRLTSLALLDGDGRTIESTSPFSEIKDFSKWFFEARDRNIPVVSSPMISLETGQLSLSIYLPVQSQLQSDTRVIRASFPFEVIKNSLKGIQLEQDSFIVLLDESGNVLLSNTEIEPMKKFSRNLPVDYWTRHAQGTYQMPDGRDFEFVSLEVSPGFQLDNNRPWRLVWFEDRRNVLALLHQASLYHFIAAIFGLALSTILGLWAGAGLSAPLQRLYRAACRASAGDLDVRLPEHTGSLETNAVAASFNRMLSQLKDTQASLRTSLVEQQENWRIAESSRSQLVASYEAVHHGLLLCDRKGGIIQTNSSLISALGLPAKSYVGRSYNEILDRLEECALQPEKLQRIRERIGRSSSARCDLELKAFVGEERVISIYSAPVLDRNENVPDGRLWIFRDLTDQRKLQEQLQQAQKMEAVGRLAGGIAHDFNNLLTSISGNLGLASHCLEDLHGEKDRMDQIFCHLTTALGSAERAGSLVTQLLGYSRSGTITLRPVRLNRTIADIEEIVVHSLDPGVEFESECDDNLWIVNADERQIQQILLNLCVNANDAIEGRGCVSVRTRNVTLGRRLLRSSAGRSSHSGDYVCIEVEDDGCGMSEDACKKVFEPFYTTKEQGKGTGLGLPMCMGIVEQHGGWIELQSEPGSGSLFSVFLPRSIHAIREAPRPATPGRRIQPTVDAGGITILVVDDEPAVRIVGENLLKRHGFNVITATNGKEAVTHCQRRGKEIDLVVMDFTMPVMCGKEAFKHMAADHPKRPVIICSGYLTDVEEFRTENGIVPKAFIQKPYVLEDFVQVVFQVLGEERQSGKSDGIVELSS